MHWWVTHYPAGDAPSREYAVRASNLEAARAKLAAALKPDVPLWHAPVGDWNVRMEEGGRRLTIRCPPHRAARTAPGRRPPAPR